MNIRRLESEILIVIFAKKCSSMRGTMSEQEKKDRNRSRSILTIVISVVVFLLLLVSITNIVIRNSLSKKTMKAIVASFDVNSEETTIDEWIYLYFSEHYDEEYLNDFMVTPESVSGVLDNTDFTTFVANKMIDYSQDILHDTGTGTFTSDEFMDFIEDNSDAISEATGRYYMPEEFVIMRQYFSTMDMFNDISASAICNRIGIPITTIRYLASYQLMYIMSGLFVLSIIGLFIINRKTIKNAFLCFGILSFVNGIVYIILKLTFVSISTKIAYRIGMGASLITSITAPVTRIVGICGIVPAIFGSVTILACILIPLLLAKRLPKPDKRFIVKNKECA